MDVDMSLDDFIQKKGIKLNRGSRSGGFRGGRQQFKRNENTNVRSNLKSNGNFSTISRGGGAGGKGLVGGSLRGVGGRGAKGAGGGVLRRPGPPVTDARLKIIQKTRKKITDAREKLVEIAKQSDARLKLKKIQEKRFSRNGGQRQKKRGGGGRVPLILRSVDPSVANPSILINDDSDDEVLGGGGVPVLQRTFANRSNNIIVNRLGRHNMNDDDDDIVIGGIDNTGDMLTDIVNDKMYSSAWPSVSRSVMSRLLHQHPTTQLKIVAHNDQLAQLRMPDRWESPAASSLNRQQAVVKRSFGVSRGDIFEGDEDVLRSHRNSRISQEMKARLDTPAVPVSRSMGVLSQPTASASQPVGHRIVVSNLQPSVTHEDIKELFEDIGPLVTSHVVRPGTAEVIYVHQKDAIAAVEAYHNRQLDGQPMKCLLVNSRPSNLSSAARAGTKYPSSTKSAVLPDISAIHKALFNK